MAPRSLAVAALLALALPASAWDGCRESADRHAAGSADGVEAVEIVAGAGDLHVSGEPGVATVDARGRACADDAEELATVDLHVERAGTRVRVVTEIPHEAENARLDLRVVVPANVKVIVTDSSGDLRVRQVAALDLRDSSGEVIVDDVSGDVQAQDSSGDLRIRNVGDLRVLSDSSGDVRVDGARSVRIDVDSSGDIIVRDVEGDVAIGDDSSGSIEVSGVGGSFTVENDSSGGIHHMDVAGAVRLPRQRD